MEVLFFFFFFKRRGYPQQIISQARDRVMATSVQGSFQSQTGTRYHPSGVDIPPYQRAGQENHYKERVLGTRWPSNSSSLSALTHFMCDCLVRSALDNTRAISIWISLWRFWSKRKRYVCEKLKVTMRDAKEDVDKVCIDVRKTSDNTGGKRTSGISLQHKTFI